MIKGLSNVWFIPLIREYSTTLTSRLLPAFGDDRDAPILEPGTTQVVLNGDNQRRIMIAAVEHTLVMMWLAGLSHLVDNQALVLVNVERGERGVDAYRGEKAGRIELIQTLKRPPFNAAFDLPKWEAFQKLEKLRFLANAVKHGPGKSADSLMDAQAWEFLIRPGQHADQSTPIDAILGAFTGFVVSAHSRHVEEFAEAAITFWQELPGYLA